MYANLLILFAVYLVLEFVADSRLWRDDQQAPHGYSRRATGLKALLLLSASLYLLWPWGWLVAAGVGGLYAVCYALARWYCLQRSGMAEVQGRLCLLGYCGLLYLATWLGFSYPMLASWLSAGVLLPVAVWVVGLVLVSFPASLLVQLLMRRWSGIYTGDVPPSLTKGGKWIGILERLFIFSFVLTGRWEAIGFILAVKSAFRIGEMRVGQNDADKTRSLTEYILIGTFLSFGLAILIGGAANLLLRYAQ